MLRIHPGYVCVYQELQFSDNHLYWFIVVNKWSKTFHSKPELYSNFTLSLPAVWSSLTHPHKMAIKQRIIATITHRSLEIVLCFFLCCSCKLISCVIERLNCPRKSSQLDSVVLMVRLSHLIRLKSCVILFILIINRSVILFSPSRRMSEVDWVTWTRV